ncbi:Essential protein Yae1, N terminal [Elasticomyces elasticus]|nr:Essential protein Yae1, N terminal [Elasticomyces elasticus]KAK3645469.1 Essential protein Yae1, N terminal [Elasticomyces elasticus]KAK4915825.1 Essential protein Yae1, N terminal [Elasticomyces elasticus]KAK5755579.1 Essential protein Yae1, N terminal [Elasticomyces elasticus]
MLRDLPPIDHDEGHDLFMTGASGNNETYSDPFDDVFGSAPGSPVLAGDDGLNTESHTGPSVHSDISRLRNTHVTQGYREGITASKERHMQDGFDEGYNLGAELGLKAGWCLGALEGIFRALPGTQDGFAGAQDSAENTLSRKNVEALIELAKKELDISHLCGKEHFGEDGLWLYEVPNQDGEEHELTFERVAAAHPLLQKWTREVMQLAEKVGLRLSNEEE